MFSFHVWLYHKYVTIHEGHKKALNTLELEL